MKQTMRVKILVMERHAAVRTVEAKRDESGLSTGKLVTWCRRTRWRTHLALASHDAGGHWFSVGQVWMGCLLR